VHVGDRVVELTAGKTVSRPYGAPVEHGSAPSAPLHCEAHKTVTMVIVKSANGSSKCVAFMR
jgi:hypothetical protein